MQQEGERVAHQSKVSFFVAVTDDAYSFLACVQYRLRVFASVKHLLRQLARLLLFHVAMELTSGSFIEQFPV